MKKMGKKGGIFSKFIFFSFTAIKYIASTSKLCSLACYRTPAMQLLDILRKTSLDKPIFCHVFSMNGCSLFIVLWDLLDEVADGDKIKKNVRGIIFDRYDHFLKNLKFYKFLKALKNA